LAKAVREAGSQAAISAPGGFAGTPEFASPEQFAGVCVNLIELAPEGEWPGDFERLFGSIGDRRFVAPERPKPEPVEV
jgi:hypothetical protein